MKPIIRCLLRFQQYQVNKKKLVIFYFSLYSQGELQAKIYWNSDGYFLHKSTFFLKSLSYFEKYVYFVKIVLVFVLNFIGDIIFIPGAFVLRCQGRIPVGLYVTY